MSADVKESLTAALAPPALRRVGIKAATGPAARPTLPARWLALLLRDLAARKERSCA